MVDVRLGAEGGDLDLDAGGAQESPYGSVRSALLPKRGAQRLHEAHDVVGPGVGGVVNLETIARGHAEDGIANRAPDRVEREARVGEGAREGTRESGEFDQPLVDQFK